MHHDVIYEAATTLARSLKDGEEVKISPNLATVKLWGRVVASGFRGIARYLSERRKIGPLKLTDERR